MKKLLTILLALFLYSCKPEPKDIAKNTEVFYMYDSVTKICYGVLLNPNIYITVTCVPCDSLKDVEVHRMKTYLMKHTYHIYETIKQNSIK